VLDSFAGSGTTGHAVLDLNRADNGSRRFLEIEMDEDVCKTAALVRTRRVVEGYTYVKSGGGKENVEGLGGGFRYCTLSSPLYDEEGSIADEVRFLDLAAHVYFAETGEPLPKRAKSKSPLLGIHNGTAVYLFYNGILGDKSVGGGNVLTGKTLAALPAHDGTRVVYGEGCRFSAARLKRERITFKQIPYQIKTG